jgi:iron complex transport system substrate-binding protein
MRPLPLRSIRFGARAARTIATAATVLALAACSPAATGRPSVPPDATGALVPPATATAPPSAAAVASPSPAFPASLTGDDGTTVQLAAAPRKIVSLTPAETEILYAIGAGDRVAGKVQDIADYPPEAKAVPVVSAFGTTGVEVDTEKIVSLGTDLVIAGGQGGTPQDAIDKLRSLKIPVLVVYAADVDGVLHDIDLTGQAVGDVQAADGLEATMKGGFEAVAKATDGVDKPRVFYETGDQPSIYGIADNSVYAQMIGLAGGTPITTGSATNWEMPTEKLLAADPQLIILGDSAYGVTADAVAKRPGWSAMTAVKNQAIEGIDDILVTRPGPRLADGLRALVAVIHPELQLGPGASAAAPSPSAAGYGG